MICDSGVDIVSGTSEDTVNSWADYMFWSDSQCASEFNDDLNQKGDQHSGLWEAVFVRRKRSLGEDARDGMHA